MCLITQINIFTSALCEGHWSHLEAISVMTTFLSINFCWRDTDPWVVSLCSSRPGVSTNMQHNLFGWPRGLDIRSNFDIVSQSISNYGILKTSQMAGDSFHLHTYLCKLSDTNGVDTYGVDTNGKYLDTNETDKNWKYPDTYRWRWMQMENYQDTNADFHIYSMIFSVVIRIFRGNFWHSTSDQRGSQGGATGANAPGKFWRAPTKKRK